jgi:uncharacterized protein YxeA
MLQNLTRRQRIAIIVAGVVFILLIVGLIIFAATKTPQNQFGNFVKIQNYDDKIKKSSPDVKDALQTYLYTVVKMNVASDVNVSYIKDAYIRDSSDTASYNDSTAVYSGTFIIDIASIKQSYYAQYAFSTSNTVDVGGNPVVISCLPKDELKYGEFATCKDLVSAQANTEDPIYQYLPYQGLTFKISPNTTSGSLVLDVTLTIPSSDLTGDAASKADSVAFYKKEATDWVTAQGLDPTKYTFSYNYSDSGELIGTPQAETK